jgi:hypothetical protein
VRTQIGIYPSILKFSFSKRFKNGEISEELRRFIPIRSSSSKIEFNFEKRKDDLRDEKFRGSPSVNVFGSREEWNGCED